ncbi:MAG: antibiotic biosynthesis monooxygenase [Bacteroidota bacterium]
MIARVWHGTTRLEDYDAYTAFLKRVAISDYKKTVGFVKLSFLRHQDDDVAHFTLITYWRNWEVIRNFAGEDYIKAKYYPEDDDYLLEFEEHVTHYEVFADETS